MNPQLYYWETFCTVKRDTVYTQILVERLDHTERCLAIFAAVSGSTAIAGWLIWQHMPYLWGGIIAASQLYAAMRTFLPFGGRLKAYVALSPELASLAMDAEHDWFKVSRGELTEDAIIDLAVKLRRAKLAATQKHMKGVVCPEKKKIATLADNKASEYMAEFIR